MRVVPTADVPELEVAFPNIDAGFPGGPGQRAIIPAPCLPRRNASGYVPGEVRTGLRRTPSRSKARSFSSPPP